MPTSPKSGEKITRSSISQMQEEVAASGQALTVDDFSRGAIGSEHLNDTVIYCARNLIAPTQGPLGDAVDYPETKNGPHWGGSGGEVLWHANERERWDCIDAYSSELHAKAAFDAGETVSENTGISSTAGNHFFSIPNEGNGFSMLFYANIRFRWNLGLGKEHSSREFNKWTTWSNGQRFWTSIIYYLRPNINSKKILKWSHADLLGASGSVRNGAGQPLANRFQNTEIIHSYQDIVTINQQTIDKLAEYSGFDVDADNLKLEDGKKCFFGWTIKLGCDRWDYGGASDASMFTYHSATGNPTYMNGMKYRVGKGNVGFIAFKYDPKTATRLVDSF